ncbi:MAG: phosphatase [Clostridiales bacterium]|nr:phosphatase [Clostridiales bacterium]
MDEKTLEQLALEERREYFRKWRANNKDKVKKHNADFWKRRVEQRLQSEQEGK